MLTRDWLLHSKEYTPHGEVFDVGGVCSRAIENYEKGFEALEEIHNVSKLTHSHPISLVGCGIYAFLIEELLKAVPGEDVFEILQRGINRAFLTYDNGVDVYLAGYVYGRNEENGIPQEWIEQLSRLEWLEEKVEKFYKILTICKK